jgi:hypothetical protein
MLLLLNNNNIIPGIVTHRISKSKNSISENLLKGISNKKILINSTIILSKLM